MSQFCEEILNPPPFFYFSPFYSCYSIRLYFQHLPLHSAYVFTALFLLSCAMPGCVGDLDAPNPRFLDTCNTSHVLIPAPVYSFKLPRNVLHCLLLSLVPAMFQYQILKPTLPHNVSQEFNLPSPNCSSSIQSVSFITLKLKKKDRKLVQVRHLKLGKTRDLWIFITNPTNNVPRNAND